MNIDTFASALLNWIIERRWWVRASEEIIGLGAPWGPRPEPWRVRLGHPVRWSQGSHPEPWHRAVSQLVQAARVKEIAARLPDGDHRGALTKAATICIDDAVDELCPPPRKIPWPRPNWGFDVVSELAGVADTFSAGPVREEILNAAAQVAARSMEASEVR